MILQKENKILRKTAEEAVDLESSEIKTLTERMAKAMFAEPDGVGIAAPQIGVSLRVFLVAKDALNLSAADIHGEKEKKERKKEYITFINPVVKKNAKKKNKEIEGCLSVRGVYGEVTRPEKITVEYFDENGKKYSRGAAGLLARIIQHELDHLNGVLFIDKAKNLKTYNIKHET